MNLPYARVTASTCDAAPNARATTSTCDAAFIHTSALYLYLKNDMAHGLSISKNTQ